MAHVKKKDNGKKPKKPPKKKVPKVGQTQKSFAQMVAQGFRKQK